MRWIVRSFIVIVLFLVGFSRMPLIEVSSGDNISTTVRYVALGDSIAYGYGLQDRETESYVGHVCQFLEKKYDTVIKTNFGENGLRSDELLDILTNTENEKHKKYCATLAYADIVTISIGSNDLLHLIKLNFNMEKMLREKKKDFEEACLGFQKNFPRIIEKIRDINPQARIFVNNIYNPAKGLSHFQGVYQVAEAYINKLNEAFEKRSGYYLVDIKRTFDGADGSMINVSLKGREIDPHPSRKGHDLIGETVIRTMRETSGLLAEKVRN